MVFVAITSTKTYGPQLANLLFQILVIRVYVAAVLKHNVIVGHLSRHLSQILSLFILRNAIINCIIIGRKYAKQELLGAVKKGTVK